LIASSDRQAFELLKMDRIACGAHSDVAREDRVRVFGRFVAAHFAS
jgi:hypothetical protein